jgi:hypothetical protein
MSGNFAIRFFENDDRGRFLFNKARNDYSQFGEDGLIEAALNLIGIKNHWCFEVGAHDGVHLSNTKRLRDEGWSALLIEAHETHFQKLKKWESDRVTCLNLLLEPGNIDSVLTSSAAPKDLDLGVIDVDGQDYFLWQGMREFQPRLMLVEYSPYDGPDAMPDTAAQHQAGINPIVALGKEKGYFPLAATYCNVLFCREDQWLS